MQRDCVNENICFGCTFGAMSLAGSVSARRLERAKARAPSVPDDDAEGPRSKWDELGATQLKKATLTSDVVIVDAAWLADLAKSGGIIPRCQHVPHSARVTLEQMELWDYEQTVGVLAISCPWLDESHPDPHGEQLQQMAVVLRAFSSQAAAAGASCKAGVFWDFMSLPQSSQHGIDDRSAEEKGRFERALTTIHSWFGSKRTFTLFMNAQIPSHKYRKSHPFSQRGWCLAESLMSGLVKRGAMLLDMSKLSGDLDMSLHEICSRGSFDRSPPMAPDEFRALLDSGVEDGTIIFTDKQDAELVSTIYTRAFISEMSAASELQYSGLGWGDDQTSRLAVALEYAYSRASMYAQPIGGLRNLCELDLKKNGIGDVGLAALAIVFEEARSGLAQLAVLELSHNHIGDAGITALTEALSTTGVLPNLVEIALNANMIGDEGAVAIANACLDKQALGKLSHMGLGHNLICDLGGTALVDALNKGAMVSLQELDMSGNPSGALFQDSIREAIQKRTPNTY